MSLNQHLKELAKKILPQSAQYKQHIEEEEQKIRWFDEQKRKFDAGEEIEPPWVSFPNSEPMTLWVSWRYGNFWLDTIWKPFWRGMDENQQRTYLKKWQPPTDDWYQTVVIYWGEKAE